MSLSALRSRCALVVGALVAAPMIVVVPPAAAAEPCAAYSSPLDCTQLTVDPRAGFQLTFDGGVGGVVDRAGAGTGFTLVQPSGAPPEHVPAQLQVADGLLRATSTAGIQFTANNTLDNGLGVALPTPVDPMVVTTRILDVPTGMTNASEQAGLWLGSNQDNLVKLVAVSRAGNTFALQLAREVNGVVGTTNEVTTTTTFPALRDLDLTLTVDPVAGTATGRYTVEGGTPQILGSLPLPPGVLTSLAPPVPGAGTAAGVFTTARNRVTTLPPITWSVDRFSIDSLTPPAPPAGLTAVPADDEVALSWQASAGPAVSGYQVFGGPGPVATTGTPLAVLPAGATTWTDTTLLLDTPRAYAVRAVTAAGLASTAASTSAVTQTGPAGEPFLRVDVVDATPSTNPGPVPGWVADSGLGYDQERGYGWLSATARPQRVPIDGSLNARQRPGLVSAWGQRRASLIHLQYGDIANRNLANGIDNPLYWEAAVPAGRYSVAVSVGDEVFDASHTVNVEGSKVVDGFVGNAGRVFDEAVVEVAVTDGFLTVDADGGTNTKIASIQVNQVEVTPPVDTTAPAVPAGLAGTAGNGSLEVSWDAVPDADVAGYRVYTGPSGAVDLTTPAAEVTVPTAVLNGLANGTAYDVVVVAFDATGNASAASAPLTLTPRAPAPVDTTPPSVPTALAVQAGDEQLTLTWQGAADAVRYLVYRGTLGVVDTDEALATVTTATWTDTDVVNGVEYSYAVVAVDAAGNESATTPPVTGTAVDATVVQPPADLAADLDGTTATLRWAAVAGAVEYRLFSRGEQVTGAGFVDTLVTAGITGTTVDVDDLAPGSSTTYFVVAVDAGDSVSAASNTVVVAVPASQTCAGSDGWTAEYFDNRTLTGVPSGLRCDPAISFDFSDGGPRGVGVGVDDFSARWTREITTPAGTYAFSSRSDDGLRITVDGQTVLDEFVDRGASAEPTVTEVPLTAGRHVIVVEYYEAGGGALVEVGYSEVTDTPSCSTDQWLAQYFDGQRNFAGAPADQECVDSINEDWGGGGPASVGSNDFSVRWTSTRTLAAGTYELQARADDGVRVYVDGTVVIDEWRDQGPDDLYTEQVTLGEGEHTFRVDYYENGGGALARVGISRVADQVECPNGWLGQYFDNQSLDGSPVRSACDAAIAFDYGLGGPAGVGVDDFSVRWTRQITTAAGTYAFSGRSDDGLRVTVDGRSIIDEFVDRGAGAPTVVQVPLTAGTHDVVVEYYENGAGALVELDYRRVADAVSCAPGQWTAQYFDGRGDFSGTPAGVDCVATIDEDWGNGGPEGVGDDDYSVRWSTTRTFAPGSYSLRAVADDGIRAYVDGELVLDEWRDQGPDTVFTETVALGGEQTVVVEYYENGGGALARFDIERQSTPDSPPAAPATLGATVVGSAVSLTWAGVADADLAGYRVYRSETSPVVVSGTPLSGTAPLSLTSYTDATAVPGTQYRYAVVAVDASGQVSAASPEATATVVPVVQPVSESWNFQPAAAPVPAGFTAETGAAYSSTTGRGWVTEATAGTATPTPLNLTLNTRDRNRTGIPQEQDTLIHMQYGSLSTANPANGVLTAGAWERNLPSGTYTVSVSVGDQRGATTYDSTHVVRAEGQTLLPSFQATAAEEYRTATGTVVVSDGRLSVDAVGGSNTKLNWIRITSVRPDTTAPAKVTGLTATGQDSAVVLGWQASTSTDTVGYRVYRSETLPVPVTGPGLGGAGLITGSTFTDTTAVNLTSYRYAVVAFDQAGNASEVTTSATVTPQPFAGLSVGVDFGTATMTPALGYLLDYGQSYGPRTLSTQGSGLTYGWVAEAGTAPLSLVGNGRVRTRAAIDPVLNSMIHMQYGTIGTNGVAAPGRWEIQVPDGVYETTVTVGDEPGALSVYDSVHAINIENAVGVESFQATAAQEYRTVTRTVRVEDGRLTVSGIGGTNTKLTHLRVSQVTGVPTVASVNPANRATGASTTGGVATSVSVPGVGVGVEPSSLLGNVSLVEVASGAQVAGTPGSSGGNDVINFSPAAALKPLTAYRFSVSNGVTSRDGAPFAAFSSLFTTGDGVIAAPQEFTPVTGVAFEKVRQDVNAGYIASMVFGPDGKLYTTSIGTSLTRYTVAADGSLSNPEALAPSLNGRAVIGIVFDQSSTAGDLRVWVTHATANLGNEPTEWSSTVSHLSGPTLSTVRDVFVGLPRSRSDHLSNSIGYGPGGDLYFLQGSNQAAGDLDGSWGTRGEKLLTAALLRFDPDHAAVQAAVAGGPAVDVQTAAKANPYDPYATTAPLKIHATGIRNAYDFSFHSNGRVYVPTNGTAAGGNSPGVDVTYSGGTLQQATRLADSRAPLASTSQGQDLTAACRARTAREPGLVLSDTPPGFNFPTQRDFLFDVVAGGYYGHPNPERCEFVLNGGSASTEGRSYTGTVPVDPNYRGVAYDFAFNKSPNGVLEYKSKSFGGQLEGRLVVVRFSNNDDLTFLQVDRTTGTILGGQVQEGVTGVPNTQIGGVGGFNDPLEVVEDPRTGNLYVNSYDRSGGQQGLFLLRVPQSQQAPAVTADRGELVFEATRSTTATRQVVVTNSGSQPVTVANAISGTDAATFSVTSGGTGVLQPGASVTVTVQFTPGSSTTVGYREARLRLTAGASTVDVGLYGLSKLGQEGSNEPTLSNVLKTLGHPVDTGWSGLAGGVDPAPKGDEVEVELFEKAGSTPVGMTPIAAYAPFEVLPFGWYTSNGTLNEVGALASNQLQTLYPSQTRGGTSFDPGTAAFGLYYDSNTFRRVGYTEDSRNAAITPDVAHRVRIYEATRRTGTTIPNAYVVAFEDASNGDYQDYVFLVTGVRPAGAGPGPDPEPEPATTVRVNFQNAAAAVPAGYVRDYGQPFAFRTATGQGDGSLRYGWIDPVTQVDLDLSVGGTTPGNGRDRDLATDQRLDTFMHMTATDVPGTFNGTKADGAWEIEVPDGRYTVTVAVGDPAVNVDPESHTIDVEDVRAVNAFVPSGAAGTAGRSRTATVEVEVLDGRLTLDASAGTNTKVNYVDIVPVDAPDPDPQADLQVNFQAAGAPAVEGWTPDNGLAFTEARGFGWVDLSTRVPVDRTAAARTRAGTGPVIERTFNIMQSDVAASAGPDGAWELVVPDGAYNVQASVGDPAFADSVHSVSAEGVRVISQFVPDGAGDYQVSDETVSVTDGRLSIEPGPFGSNTKIQWVRVTAVDPATDLVDPVLAVAVTGDAAPGGGFYNRATVTATASDTGGSGLAGITVAVDGAPAAPYTAPVVVTGAGPHTVTVVASDGAGNTTTRTVQVQVVVVEPNDGVLTSQNPEAAPFVDRYVMSRTESTVQDPALKDTSTIVLRNTGTEPVVVTQLVPPGTGFVLEAVPTLPVTVPVNGTLQVGVRFTGTSPTTINRIWNSTVGVVSDAANGPLVSVEVAGVAQDRAEGGTEPNVAQIAETFGLGTSIVDPTSTRSAAAQLNNQGRLEALGDEVLSPYWARLDGSKPVTVRQLAAYHSCCASTATFFTHAKGSTTTQSRLTHNGAWAQTLLPRINGSTTNPALASFTPASQLFGFKIDPEWSDPSRNNKSVDQCPGVAAGVETATCTLGHHLRIWPVEDRAGVAVPGQYLVVMDYSGINYDFNDNVYLVTNIVPEAQVDVTAPPAPTGVQATVQGSGAGASVQVSWSPVQAADLAGYHVERSNGPSWTRLTVAPTGATSFSDTAPPVGTAVSYRVIAVDQSGNASAAVQSGTVTVPAPPTTGFTPVRVNAGGPAVTVGGVAFAADAGFSGGKTYTNPAVTQIAGTTADPLYLTERSSTTSLGSFSYAFPVPAGTYDVRLHFAEIYHGATGGGAGGTGKRVLSVNAEGGPVEVANLDLNAVAAPMTAVVRDVRVPVSDGTLDLAFSATVDQPKVSAIEVVQVVAPPADTTAPAAPGAPTATPGTAGVALSWSAVTAADLAGYRVERQSSGGAFTSLTPALLTATSFTDTTAPVGVPLGYRVLAVDTSGNVSAPSTTATATVAAPADTTPPAVPAGLTATVAGTSVQLGWSAVTASDLAGYHVERSAAGAAFQRLTTTLVSGTSFTDAAPPTGVALGYRVLSADTTGNLSAPSSTASATVPASPTGAQPVRINAGGPAVTTGGVAWAADGQFSGGKTYTNPSVTAIAGTTDDVLYLTERSSTTNLGSFSYAVPRPNGQYTVRLHFAEIYHGATGGGAGGTGKRVLSVNAEGGAPEVANLDLNAVAAPMTAVVREFGVALTDGTLDLAFTATVNQPTVSAIEVLPSTTPALQTAFSYTALAAQPVSNSEAQGVTVAGAAYSFGGFDSQKACCTPTSRAYRLAAGATSWTPLAPLPHLAGNGGPGTGVTHAGIATDGTDVYLAGGYVSADGSTGQTFGTAEVYRYVTASNTYQRLPDLPQPSASGVLGHLDGALHFAGGTNPGRTADRTEHYVLDPGATSWRTAAPMPAPRNHAGATVAGGRWYVVGGQTGHDGTSTTHAQVWSYATTGNAWRAEPSLPQARGHAAVFTLDGDVVIAGGMPVHGTSTAQVDRLRPGASAWQPMTALPTARSSGTAGALSGGRWLYSTGGTAAGLLATPVG